MTILRSGTTQQYSDNWSLAFGKSTGGSKTKKAGTKQWNYRFSFRLHQLFAFDGASAEPQLSRKYHFWRPGVK